MDDEMARFDIFKQFMIQVTNKRKLMCHLFHLHVAFRIFHGPPHELQNKNGKFASFSAWHKNGLSKQSQKNDLLRLLQVTFGQNSPASENAEFPK